MGLYLGGLITRRIFASEVWGPYFGEGLLLLIYMYIFFFFWGGGGLIIGILRCNDGFEICKNVHDPVLNARPTLLREHCCRNIISGQLFSLWLN